MQIRLLATALALALAHPGASQAVTPGQVTQAVAAKAVAAKAGAATSTWLVVFDEPPVASFTGFGPGAGAKRAALQPTSPIATGRARLDAQGPASKAYRGHLAGQREAVLGAARARLGRALAPTHVYEFALNGMAVRVSAAEAEVLRALPGVRSVEPEFQRRPLTDAGPAWIHADQVWSTAAPLGNRGEGVVIGVIDTGINHAHPAFAEVGPKDAFRHANPLGRRFGVCASGAGGCNDKLIGIYDFSNEGARNGGDIDGHGSHVASTAAGNLLDHSFQLPTGSVPRPISGVAPHANLISYKACRADDPDTEAEEACNGSWLIAAIDQAVEDGVDIINYSIGGEDPNPWACVSGGCNADEEAMLNAHAAGVLSVVAAGNNGPGPSSVTTPGNAPWVLTVANASHDRVIANRLIGLTGGTAPPPGGGVLVGAGFTAGTGSLPIVVPSDFPGCGTGSALGTDADGQPDGSSNPWAADPGNRFNGEIVVCERGTHARVAKSDNVRREGAGGFVLVNSATDAESVAADAHSLPGTHLGYTDGRALVEWLQGGSGHRARIEGTTVQLLPERADVLAASSGRGPALFGPYLLPDVAAPGTDILAASHSGSGTALLSGTSMASPHVAGAAALLKSAHPTWTPSDLASALVSTARPSARREDAVTLATAFDQGGGVVDAARAVRAGLSFRVSAAEYRAANPEMGGDPKTLNDPSLIDDACFQTCTFTRRVTDLAGGGAWRVVSGLPAGAVLTATPSQFTLAAGATQTVAFHIDVRAAQLPGDWVEGHVRFERVTEDDVTDAAIPLTVFADPGELPQVTITTAAEAGHHDLTLSGLVALPDARFAGTALASLDVLERTIGQDYTADDPYDSFTEGAFQRSITVPASPGTHFRLVVTTSSSAIDVDLFVGRDANGDGAELAEELCRSRGFSSSELCAVDIVGTDQEQTYWAVAQNFPTFEEGADAVRLETALVDMEPNADGALMATGPGHTSSGESFDLRVGFDDPTLLPGATHRGYVLLGTNAQRLGKTAALLVDVQRTAQPQAAAVALQPGRTRRMWLAGGAAQDRLYIDVPPNASALTLTSTGIGEVDLYAAQAPGASGPVIAAAPARASAHASATGTGAAGTITLGGAALQPGRWYVTPVNTGNAQARVNITATLAYATARPATKFGAYFNPARSGTGVFLYEAGPAWALIWYAFLEDGTPTWYLGSAPAPSAEQGAWTVKLSRFTWNGSAANGTEVGEAVLSLLDPQRFTFSWNIDGGSGSETLQWIDAGGCPAAVPRDLTGSWYAPSLSGYGYSINVHPGLETSAAYFYDDEGRARWAFGASDGTGAVPLSQYDGACPLCAYRAPLATPVGSFVREWISESSGHGALDIDLVAPLSGSWNTAAPIAKITDPLGCGAGD